MKKWYDGMTAAKMMNKVEKEWTERGEYTEGRRGPNGELGWKKTYVVVEGVTYVLTYGREGWPELTEA